MAPDLFDALLEFAKMQTFSQHSHRHLKLTQFLEVKSFLTGFEDMAYGTIPAARETAGTVTSGGGAGTLGAADCGGTGCTLLV